MIEWGYPTKPREASGSSPEAVHLNGLGWIGGVLVLLSRYWRREFYLVAAGYGLLTIIAFIVFAGPINPLSIISKVAEAVVVLLAVYLNRSEPPT